MREALEALAESSGIDGKLEESLLLIAAELSRIDCPSGEILN